MKNGTKYWGCVGAAVGLCFSFALLCASQSPLHDLVRDTWLVVTYPVTKAWLAFFRTVEGDRGMIFILPMLVSQLLFVVALGFGAGALLSRFRGVTRAKPDASPNGGLAVRSNSSKAVGGPPSVS